MQETGFPSGGMVWDSAFTPLSHALALNLAGPALSPAVPVLLLVPKLFHLPFSPTLFLLPVTAASRPGMIFLAGSSASGERYHLFPSLVIPSPWAEPQALHSGTCHPLVMSPGQVLG